MSTGGCGISLDRDSVSKEFQSRIVLGKRNAYIHQYEQPEQQRKDRDPNNESEGHISRTPP